MRKLTRRTAATLGLVPILLTTVVGNVQAATNMEKSRAESVVAQVIWGDADEKGEGRYGNLAVYVQGRAAGLSYIDEDLEIVLCDAGTADSSDDYEGFVGTVVVGDGPVTSVSIPANLRAASAAGTVDLYGGTMNECSMEWGFSLIATDVPISMSLTAAGRGETWVDVYREVVPGEYSVRQTSRMRGYPASGSATLDGQPVLFEVASIARFSSSTMWKQ